MDATVFLTHFNTAFSTYTPFTNQSIWWFAAQSDAIQVSIINSLCAANDTIDVKISTLDIVEQTFDLAKAPESAVQMCLLAYNINDHMKDTVKSQIQLGALNQFLFSPFSPGSKRWIRKQDEDTQVDAIYYICEQYGFTAEQIIQVTDYLFGSGGLHELSTKTLGALTLCASSAYFVLHSDSNTSIQWFGRQNLVIQQRLLVRFCAAKEIPTGNLKHIFGTLRRDASNTTIQLYDFIFDGCIATREYSMADIVKRFAGNLDAKPVHVWVAFQNISQQLNFIDYMYSGKSLLDHQFFYSYSVISKLFTSYTDYLSSVGIATKYLTYKSNQWEDFYASMEDFESDISFLGNTVWFGSQNLTTQIRAMNHLCADQSFDSDLLVKMFHNLVLLTNADFPLLDEMHKCERSESLQLDTRVKLYAFVSYGICCLFMILSYSVIVFRQQSQSKTPKKQSKTPKLAKFDISMIINLLSLLCYDIVIAVFWANRVYTFFKSLPSQRVSQGILYVLIFVFTSSWNISYLHLSYMRSETILKMIWPNSVRLIKLLFKYSFLILVSPVIFSILEFLNNDIIWNTLTWATVATNDIVLLILDGLLVYTFAKHVSEIRRDVDVPNKHLDIISRWGGAAGAVVVLISISSITTMYGLMAGEGSYMMTSVVIMAGLMHVVSALLLGMKYRLYRESLLETARTVSSNQTAVRK